jgi:hypothetical protein
MMIIINIIGSISGETREKERVKAARKNVLGMCVAATAGVIAGIIIAPKSGKETREDLKKITVTT